jgi:aspartate kinase
MNRTKCSLRGHRNSPVASEAAREDLSLQRSSHGQARRNPNRALRIMKFGGTSVGDAACIGRVVEIVKSASSASDIVVVVSAMSGVTNKLIEAAAQAEAGNRAEFTNLFGELRKQHQAAVDALIHSDATRERIHREMQELFQEGECLCEGTTLVRELTLRVRDSISSLGERLSAPLVSAALAECGVASEYVSATEVVVTNANYGCAEPKADLTRTRSEMKLRGLLQQGVVPVVNGFIGATEDGVLTTLGRGGSDYSASILGTALNANEVIIWTDVDGMLTADPHVVSDACSIPEMSYVEAAELAYFGAKVLHPKTLYPLMQQGIALSIRNTFAPERPGTKITAAGPTNGTGATALAAISDAAMITIDGSRFLGVQDLLSRTFATTAAVHADPLLISQASSQNRICLVVSSAQAKRTVEALLAEFALDFADEKVDGITLDSMVAIVTVVGPKGRGASDVVGRVFGAMGRENIEILAIANGASASKISFVVARKDVKEALLAAHRELQLGGSNPPLSLVEKIDQPSAWCYASRQATVEGN